MFDAHPPFQIDGNFGGTAGITEMLVQSTAPHAGSPARIELLPAVPPVWQQGSATGLCTRGGFEVNIKWHDGKLAGAEITNMGARAKVNVAYADKQANLALESGVIQSLNAQLSQVVAPH